MNDDFKSLKQLGKKIHSSPPAGMLENWKRAPYRTSPFQLEKINWWQLAAALIAGILIGKFLLQTSPEFFSMVAKNQMDDETFEYIYTNN